MENLQATIKFACPNCTQKLEIESDAAGQIIECPACKSDVCIPSQSGPSIASVSRRNLAIERSRKQKKPVGFILLLFILIMAVAGGGYWILTQQTAQNSVAENSVAQVPADQIPVTSTRIPEEPIVVETSPKNETVLATSIPPPSEGETIMANLFTKESAEAAKFVPVTDNAPAVLPKVNKSLGPQGLADARGWDLTGKANVQASQFGGPGSGTEEITDMVARGDGRMVMVGVLSSRDGVPPSGATHALVDNQDGGSNAFVAELSADGERFLWFSVFGANIIHPTCLALGPDGSIAIGGGQLDRTAQVAGPDSGNFGKSKSVVLKVTADGSEVEWIRAGASNQEAISDIAVDSKGRLVYLAGSYVRGAAAYVFRKNPDGSESFFTGQPSGREWAIDFDVRGGLFMEEGQIGAYYAKGKSGDGYDYDGPGKWGPVRFKLLGIRQNGHVVLMPNDDIVVCGTLQYDFREKGKKQYPAFDTIVARFREDGSLIWSSNLYQPNDSVHTPDQKDADMIYNPVNGDLYLLIGQHGSNVYRFKGELVGDTGNLFIYWVGQVNAETGDIKEGWYWQNSRNTGYNSKGIPQSPPHPNLAGNRGTALDVDSLGNIYMVGDAGAKAFTTGNAWQSWPEDQNGGGNAALTVLSPSLDRILYATMIKGPEQGKISANALVVTSRGVWVGGKSNSGLFPSNPKPWSGKTLSGESDVALTRFKFD